jgi:hypothetical protein
MNLKSLLGAGEKLFNFLCIFQKQNFGSFQIVLAN